MLSSASVPFFLQVRWPFSHPRWWVQTATYTLMVSQAARTTMCEHVVSFRGSEWMDMPVAYARSPSTMCLLQTPTIISGQMSSCIIAQHTLLRNRASHTVPLYARCPKPWIPETATSEFRPSAYSKYDIQRCACHPRCSWPTPLDNKQWQ